MDVISVDVQIQTPRWRQAARRFCQSRMSVVGAAVLLVILLCALLAPVLAPYDPMEIDMAAFRQPPSAAHPLGTDNVGRDVLSRLLYAGRISMGVGLGAVAVYLVIGVILGAAAGYLGGWADAAIMRLTDAVMSFPLMVLMIALVAILGQSVLNIVLIIALVGWPGVARLVRGEILSLKSQEFVEAARASGEGTLSIIFRQLIPNCMGPIIVNGTFGVANAILMEASLSFLGLGIQPPAASWGYMLMDAQSISILTRMPWLWLPPGLIIFVSVICINFIGDGLRDALDPKLSR